MKRFYIVVLSLVLGISTCFGQSKELVEAFGKKELIILLLEENEEVIKKIKGEKELAFHQAVIGNYNSLMKEMAPE